MEEEQEEVELGEGGREEEETVERVEEEVAEEGVVDGEEEEQGVEVLAWHPCMSLPHKEYPPYTRRLRKRTRDRTCRSSPPLRAEFRSTLVHAPEFAPDMQQMVSPLET